MRFFVCIAAGISLIAAAVSSAWAQLPLADLQSKMAGSWLVTVEGEARTRTMVIETVAQKAEGTYVIIGTFNFSDGKPTPFKDGELLQSSGNLTLVLTTGAGSVYAVTAKPDGTFAGTTKYTNGQVKPTIFAKGAASPTAAPVAAGPVVAFDGKWGGPAEARVDNCSRGDYDLEIKEGRIAGTASFYTSLGTRVSNVTGQVRSDGAAVMTLAARESNGRSSRVQGKFEGGGFKAIDPPPQGGRCAYDVTLKKKG